MYPKNNMWKFPKKMGFKCGVWKYSRAKVISKYAFNPRTVENVEKLQKEKPYRWRENGDLTHKLKDKCNGPH